MLKYLKIVRGALSSCIMIFAPMFICLRLIMWINTHYHVDIAYFNRPIWKAQLAVLFCFMIAISTKIAYDLHLKPTSIKNSDGDTFAFSIALLVGIVACCISVATWLRL